MANPLRDNIMAYLCQVPYFKEYKYRKRDRTLTRAMPWGSFSIEFLMWQSWDSEVDDYACEVIPNYHLRFDVAKKWFEKFGVKPLRDQRDQSTIMFGGQHFGFQPSFLFLYDASDFDIKIAQLREDATLISDLVLSEYGSLEKMYRKKIEPVQEWPDSASDVDWHFEYLKICSIVNPDGYYDFKAKIIDRINYTFNRKYPNPSLLKYRDKLDAIFADIEQTL